MAARPLTVLSSSSFRSPAPSQILRTTCIHQQSRGLKYETYAERRAAAKEWLTTKGARFRRPAGRGRTNYLLARSTDSESDEEKETASSQNEVLDDTKWSDKQLASQELASNAALRQIVRRAPEDVKAIARDEADKLKPFPLNQAFRSQPVLSEELREMIYLKVIRDGLTVRTVSTLMGVTMERVGAVVRMKQMERDWVKKGKPLAVPYSRAVLDMIPTTEYVDPTDRANVRNGLPPAQTPHEPINDLPVLPITTQQTFVSVPESRQFTRRDAAEAFSPSLKPADERIPHSELVEIEKFRLEGAGTRELQDFTARMIEDEKRRIAAQAQQQKAREEARTSWHKTRKWDFKFTDISVDTTVGDGRSRAGVGWRYGQPHEDRKRGQVKIPTSVP